MANTTLLDKIFANLTESTALTWADYCIQELNGSDFDWDRELVDGNGNYISELTSAWGIKVPTCHKYCNLIPIAKTFSFQDFSGAMTNYFLPWLALTAQLPFETGDLWSNTMSFCLAVGSPAFVTYSLTITILNRYWVRKRFNGLLTKARSLSIRQKYREYEDRIRAAQYLLQEAQQVPLRASQEKGWLSSLVVIPKNEIWWEHLEGRLRSTRRGVTASLVAQMLLASVTYLFTVITSLVASLGDQGAGLQIASGSLWIWLIPVILGWITVGTQYSHRSIDDALRAELAERALEPPIQGTDSELQDQRGLVVRGGLSPQPSLVQTVVGAVDTPALAHLEIPNWLGADVEGDEKRKGPIYNYARLFTWWQLASTLHTAFWQTLENVRTGEVVYETAQGQPRPVWDSQKPSSNLEGDIKGTAGYCGLHKVPVVAFPKWSDIPSPIYRRILAASLWGLFVQWGTTGASILIAFLTPTIGLGCRSGSYLLYGVLGTTVWVCLLTSMLLSHEAMLRYQKEHRINPSMDFRLRPQPKSPNPNQYSRDRTHSAFCAAAVILRYIGKTLAVINTLWLVISSLMEFVGGYDN